MSNVTDLGLDFHLYLSFYSFDIYWCWAAQDFDCFPICELRVKVTPCNTSNKCVCYFKYEKNSTLMSIFSVCHLWCDLCQRPTDLLDVFLSTSLAIIILWSGRKVDEVLINIVCYWLLISFLVGTVVGHFAGLAASILIGDWLVSFITSQVSWIW